MSGGERRRRRRLPGASSLMSRLAGSIMLGLALLWLVGVIGSAVVLQRLIDGKSDDELQETALILVSFISRTPDLAAAAEVLAEAQTRAAAYPPHDRFAYRVVDGAGRLLLRSANAPAGTVPTPLREGLADVDGWRVATLQDRANARYLQVADPLAERRETLFTAVLWLTAPLGVLLAFAAFMVLRTSRSLMDHVQRTAKVVGERDPKAMGMLPLSGVATEMRPAVEATNQLLGRVSEALEAERSFTYNSAHELRTPIAAALAQAQLMASLCADQPELGRHAGRLVESMTRLARLAERLLALARAEGNEPLTRDWVDLERVVRLTVAEFSHDPRLAGRRLVADAAPARVRGDVDAIGLALRNLVENALAHGVGGRSIRVASGPGPRGCYLAVTDDGAGVHPDELPTLTERFKRGSRGTGAGQGAGLGLAIVAMLARRLGARLTLRSPPPGAETGFEARLDWVDAGDRDR